MTTTFVLYGANGYTGRLIASEALRRGLTPILAGRRERAIAPLAEALGVPWRCFALDDPPAIARAIQDSGALLAAAGPFSGTYRPLLDACMRTRTPYLDLNGDTQVFTEMFAARERIAAAGSLAIPGVGFDVAPSDCLAAMVARDLPDATHLEVVWGGDFEPSRGTARSMLEVFPRGGLVRRNHELVRVPTAWRTIAVPFPSGPRTAVSVPWGDVVTAWYSTGIPNITAYAAMGRAEIWSMRALRPFFALMKIERLRRWIDAWIARKVSGPGEELLVHGRSYFRVRAERDGAEQSAWLVGPEGYVLTARASVEAVRRVLVKPPAPGVRTVSQAFGADFIQSVEGCVVSASPTTPRAVERRGIGIAA